MLVIICRSMNDGILGIFSKREDAESSFKQAFPEIVFDGVTVAKKPEKPDDKPVQVGWITEHIVERNPIDFKPLIPVPNRLG